MRFARRAWETLRERVPLVIFGSAIWWVVERFTDEIVNRAMQVGIGILRALTLHS